MIDKANFYKLPKEEQNKEKLWENASPDVKQFADNLVEEIRYSDTPFVLGIDGGYGIGKTYFSTRFTEYLKEKDINAIYCSVWENDYLENPFIAISKEILKQLNVKKYKIKESLLIKLIKNCVLDLQFFGISGNTITKSFIKRDSIEKFKDTFKKEISKLPNKKLVLIIDELDRCKPDFAVKTLEILKHLFDIEGLYVILMINKDRLNQHINAFYNLPFDNKENGEEFLQKFINRFEYIPTLNYEVVVNDFLTIDRLKHAIDKGNITEDETKFNGFKELKDNIIECCNTTHITYRETIELINKCIDFCNYYKEAIRCKFLPYELIKYDLNVKILNEIRNKLLSILSHNIKQLAHLTNNNVPTNNNFTWKEVKEMYNNFASDYFYQSKWGVNRGEYISENQKKTAKYIYDNLVFSGVDGNEEMRAKEYDLIAKDFHKLYEKSKKQ